MGTRMEIIRYKVDPADGRKSGWIFEGHGQDAPSKDGSAVLAQAVALLSRGARVLQVVKIPNTEYQDVPPHFGILLEDR
jgi:hypothetical protein